LVGGLGKRLRGVISDRPKPMADIGGNPFLDLLIDYTSSFGVTRYILATGFMSDSIQAYYQKKDSPRKIVFSNEERPLGTAGAVKNAEDLIKSNPFIVMNGDSFCAVDLHRFLEFHIEKKALFSAALVPTGNTRDFGVVGLNDNCGITRFEEKKVENNNTFISAGIYIFQKEIFSLIPSETKYSFEYDVFPKLIDGKFYGFVTDAELTDIGTPERYFKAKKNLSLSKV
jgi:D-glycero-alpha-D-manno-heptose 1-phosphate guanylyltransferase